MIGRQIFVTILLLTIFAQSNGLAHQQAGEAIKKLNIVIVEGEGAVNNARQRVARDPMVQVEDENRKPIAGAAVVFLLPNQGAGASFANGARSLTVLTDSEGQAVARGMQANKLSGQNSDARDGVGQRPDDERFDEYDELASSRRGSGRGHRVEQRWGGPERQNPTVITPGTPTVGAPR